MKKAVELVAAPREPHYVGDGFRVHNFIPGGFRMDMERMNPFIMMDYNSKFHFPPSDQPKGVGVHPHRGFETVTIAYQGKVAHHDSAGGGGIIGQGDVQWMTAASGVLHKEYHEAEFSRQGGLFQMVQLWVNLPAAFKMSPPKYQAIANQDMPKIPLPNSGGYVEVIAGEFKGTQGPASTYTPVNMFNAKLKAQGEVTFSFPANYTTCCLVVEGDILVNENEHAAEDHFVLFEKSGEEFTIKANKDSIVLILSGEPILEPIAAYGPFVMNTREEIMQAFTDFNQGKFGYLED